MVDDSSTSLGSDGVTDTEVSKKYKKLTGTGSRKYDPRRWSGDRENCITGKGRVVGTINDSKKQRNRTMESGNNSLTDETSVDSNNRELDFEVGIRKRSMLDPPEVHRYRLQIAAWLAIVFALIGAFAVKFVRVEMLLGGLTVEKIDLTLEERVGEKGAAAFGTGTENDEVPIVKQIAAYFGCLAIPLMAGVSLTAMSRADEFGGQKEIAQGWGVACAAYGGAMVVCLLLLLSYDGQRAEEPLEGEEKPKAEENYSPSSNWSRWSSVPLEGWILVFLSAVSLLVGGLCLGLSHWREVQNYQDFVIERDKNRKLRQELDVLPPAGERPLDQESEATVFQNQTSSTINTESAIIPTGVSTIIQKGSPVTENNTRN